MRKPARKGTSTALLFLSALLLLACGTTGHGEQVFVYDYPTTIKESSVKIVVGFVPVIDSRELPDDIDLIIDLIYVPGTKLADEVSLVMTDELKASGMFRLKMLPLEKVNNQKALDDIGARYSVALVLKKLLWYVPNYKDFEQKHQDAIMAAGIMFGTLVATGVAVTAAGPPVDVYGLAELNLGVYDKEEKRFIILKKVSGQVKEEMFFRDCATPQTKARIVGAALKNAATEIIAELQRVLAPETSRE